MLAAATAAPCEWVVIQKLTPLPDGGAAAAHQFTRRLALALDTALSMSSAYLQQQQQGGSAGAPGATEQWQSWQPRQPPQYGGGGGGGGGKSGRRQHVYGAALVRGTAFYGFHEHESVRVALKLT